MGIHRNQSFNFLIFGLQNYERPFSLLAANGFVYAQYGRIAHIGVYTVLHSVLIFNHFLFIKIKIMNYKVFFLMVIQRKTDYKISILSFL